MPAVPAPVLDDRNEDQIAAEAIGALPAELSDRSDSNPAVVVIEAAAYVVGRYLYQLNRWPAAVVQKALALIGVTMRAAVAATVTQKFSVANPQPTDTVIPTGTQVSIADGSIIFATTADATIPAYVSNSAGTVSTTAGVTTVTGSGTAFILGSSMVGWQIQIPSVTGTWYTIASVTDATHLELTASATATVAGAAWYTGPVSTTVSAEATTGGAATNVGAAKLTTLVSGVSGIASTTNPAAATGGLDAETTADAIARAPVAFATRDMACTAADYAEFAQRILGSGSRAKAKENYNIAAPTQGYVSVALLSPSWAVAAPVSASERKTVLADLQGRRFFGATTIDLPASIYQPTPAAIVWRTSSYDATTVRVNVAAALNTYVHPSTYPWGRILYTADLADEVEAADGVDRVHVVDGIACVGTGWGACPAAIAFVLGATTHLTANTTGYVANRTILWDATNNKAYLVKSFVAATSVTIDRAYESANNSQTPNRFKAQDDDMNGGTSSPLWYSLPYASLSVDATAPAASVLVIGAAT